MKRIQRFRRRLAGSPRGDRGFTLISVIIATVMLSIGLLALARTQTALVSAEGALQRRNTALSIAQAYLDQERSGDLWALVVEAPTAVNEHGQASGSGIYRRSVDIAEVVAGQPNLIQLTVTVSYPGSANAVQLATLIYRRV
jgi:type II secretory pathway pseudopilin PulG